MIETIDKIEIRYFNEFGDEVDKTKDHKTTRISVWIDKNNDNHHLELPSKANRNELAGALINLGHRVARGIDGE